MLKVVIPVIISSTLFVGCCAGCMLVATARWITGQIKADNQVKFDKIFRLENEGPLSADLTPNPAISTV